MEQTYQLHVRNMVCPRCIKAVEDTFDSLNIKFEKIDLGVAQLKEEPSESQLLSVEKSLSRKGFELILDRDNQLIVKIKAAVVKTIHYSHESQLKTNSDFLSEKLGENYRKLSKIFKEHEGITLEKFIIVQKIEKGKGTSII